MADQNITQIQLSVIDQFGVPHQIKVNADVHFKAINQIDRFLADIFAGQHAEE